MENEDYIEHRLNNQIQWYEKKSKFNKSRYFLINNLCIFFSAFIPTIVLIINFFQVQQSLLIDLFMALIGIILLSLFSLSRLYDFRDKWNHYREVAEKLKAEKNLFLNKSGVYSDSSEPNKLLTERVESLISPRHTD